MWRKNRRNNHGVDLNRNYDFGWNSRCSGSTTTSSETYKGTAPFSEYETQAVLQLTKKYLFSKVIDYHSRGKNQITSRKNNICWIQPLYTWTTTCQ
jgi:carboxypeptidase T